MKAKGKGLLVFVSALLGVVSTALLHIPIVGALWGLVTALPLSWLFPYLGKTGEHVEVGAFWLTIKSAQAWWMYTVYYALVWMFLIGFYRTLTARKRRKRMRG